MRLISTTKLQLTIILILSALAYSNIFQNQFVIDDPTFIVDWQTKNSLQNIPKLLSGEVPPGHEGVYRPLRSILYSLYYQIGGTNPFIYHLHAILVHLISTILTYLITRQIVSSIKYQVSRKKSIIHNTYYLIPFITSLLFGLHPIHTETITYIASSLDTTGVVFLLGSFYLYLRSKELVHFYPRPYILSIIFAILAFFTFEVTLVLPLLIILYDLCFRFKSLKFLEVLKNYTLFFIPAAVYLFIRFFLLHVGQRGPYLAGSIYLTFLTMTKVFVKYLSLNFFPVNLANNHTISKGIEAFVYRDYREEAIKAQTIFDPYILFSIIIITFIIIIAIKSLKKNPLVTFGIAWFFIPLLPVSEIIPQGSMLNERFLYLPSFGFCFLLAYLLTWLIHKIYTHENFRGLTPKTFILASLFLILIFYFYQTVTRNKDWHDSISLWSKDIKVYSNDNAYAYFQLGNAYSEKGNYDLAIENYQKSSQINPKFAVSLGSIGLLYEKLNQREKAIEYYKKAISNNPNFWEGYLKLRNIYLNQGKEDLANEQFQKYLELFSKKPE